MDLKTNASIAINAGDDSLLERVGNTPLKCVYFRIRSVLRPVYLKLEGTNPTGSLKDRTAAYLIDDIERRCLIRRSSVIIESSSGNLAVALASICLNRGYHLLVVIDPRTSPEKRAAIEELGASVVEVNQPDTSGSYLLSRLEKVHALCERSTRFIWTDQYSNPANPMAHYLSTGPEIYQQMDQSVDAIFVGVSTGGTLAGVGQYFREHSPNTWVIGVDASGSVALGGRPGPRLLTGIGSAQRSRFATPELYHSYTLVTDAEAFGFCRALDAATHIKIGGSSGATLAACARYLYQYPRLERPVCLCADRGEHYQTTVFSDRWLTASGIRIDNPLPFVDEIVSHKSPDQPPRLPGIKTNHAR